MEDPMAIDKKLIDQLLTDYKKPEDIIGKNGPLKELTKALLERAVPSVTTMSASFQSKSRDQRTNDNRAASLRRRGRIW